MHQMENFSTLLGLTELTGSKDPGRNCGPHQLITIGLSTSGFFSFTGVFCLSLIVLLTVFLLKREYLTSKLECFISGETLSW